MIELPQNNEQESKPEEDLKKKILQINDRQIELGGAYFGLIREEHQDLVSIMNKHKTKEQQMTQIQRCFPGTEISELEKIRKKYHLYKELEE